MHLEANFNEVPHIKHFRVQIHDNIMYFIHSNSYVYFDGLKVDPGFFMHEEEPYGSISDENNNHLFDIFKLTGNHIIANQYYISINVKDPNDAYCMLKSGALMKENMGIRGNHRN